MSETPSPTTRENLFDLAIPVADRVQILNVLVVESRCKRDDDERFNQGGIALRYHHGLKGVNSKPEASQITVNLLFSVTTTKDGIPEVDPFFFVECTISLVYSLDSFVDIDQEKLVAFALTNGVYNAWPYWREFVQSSTVRMGLPALVPPVFRFRHEPTETTGE